jgi:hypothetical protein
VNNATKWALVVPVAVAATLAAWVGLTLVWNLTSAINVVPQGDVISIGLANFGINAFAAGIGVLAGAHRAPAMRRQTAVALAAATTLFAVATLAFGAQFRATASMSLAWHIWSTFAWVVGAAAAVAYVWKNKVTTPLTSGGTDGP